MEKIGQWRISVDREATQNAYADMDSAEKCACCYCRNYDNAVFDFPMEVQRLFEDLGIDIAQPAELMHYTVENGVAHTGGWYHIVGEYQEGEELPTVAPKRSRKKQTDFVKLAEGFYIGFTRCVKLVDDKFPRPVLQMEIDFRVHWVLEEPYDR